MSSLKQLIYNTLYEIATPAEGVEQKNYATAEEARDEFIAKVMAKLFPEESAPVTKAKKSPKKAAEAKAEKSPKKSPEDKAAAKAEKAAAKAAEKAAKEAEKAAAKAAKEAEKEAAKAAKQAEKEAKKAAKSPKKEAPAPAPAAEEKPKKSPKKSPKKEAPAPAPAAEEKPKKSPKKSPAAEVPLPASPIAEVADGANRTAPVKQRAKPGPKPKAPANPNANLQKIDPTWRKALKEADKEHAKELEPELLKFLNDMSNAAFHGKGAKEHVAAFLASRKPAEDTAEAELEVVGFNGTDYYVNPETKRVYEGELDEDGNLKVTRPVGYVGMADFKDMTLE